MPEIWKSLLGTAEAELCGPEPEALLERCRAAGLMMTTVTGPGHHPLLPSPHTRPACSAHAILSAPFEVGFLMAPISQLKRPKHRKLLTQLRSPG